MTLTAHPTPIAGVLAIDTAALTDERGSFMRLFCEQTLAPFIGDRRVRQINHSLTLRRGAVRGLHYQLPPHAEVKFVRCLRGRVWDVAVDLRKGSPTFAHWHAEELSSSNRRMLLVPEGCAHGFQALEDHSELLYLHTAVYSGSLERGVSVLDPRLAIPWPLDLNQLSVRDAALPRLEPDFPGVVL